MHRILLRLWCRRCCLGCCIRCLTRPMCCCICQQAALGSMLKWLVHTDILSLSAIICCLCWPTKRCMSAGVASMHVYLPCVPPCAPACIPACVSAQLMVSLSPCLPADQPGVGSGYVPAGRPAPASAAAACRRPPRHACPPWCSSGRRPPAQPQLQQQHQHWHRQPLRQAGRRRLDACPCW